jgi:hypothetical protein
MPDRDRPPTERDCLDCGAALGMRLQNAFGTTPANIPLLYVCRHCGAMLTIPPPKSPVVA